MVPVTSPATTPEPPPPTRQEYQTPPAGERPLAEQLELSYLGPESADLSSFMLDPIALSPRPFVHDRQTVRTSERMAEIWVSLPEGYHDQGLRI